MKENLPFCCDDCFAVLALKRDYFLDKNALLERRNNLVKRAHPDFTKSAVEQTNIVDMSKINRAFNILSDDIMRAGHIFHLMNLGEQRILAQNSQLNMEIFTLYEELTCSNSQAELNLLKSKVATMVTSHLQAMEAAFKSKKELEYSLNLWQKAFFLNRFATNIQNKIRELTYKHD